MMLGGEDSLWRTVAIVVVIISIYSFLAFLVVLFLIQFARISWPVTKTLAILTTCGYAARMLRDIVKAVVETPPKISVNAERRIDELHIVIRRIIGMHDILQLRIEGLRVEYQRHIVMEANDLASIRSMQEIIWEEWRIQYGQLRREISVIEEWLKDNIPIA